MDTSNLALPFLERARADPHHVALSIEGRTTSYAQLADFAGRIATWLRRSGPEGRVGVLAHRSRTSYATVLGACLAGQAWVPIGLDLPLERQREILRRGGVRKLIADRAVDARLIDGVQVAVLSPENLPQLDDLVPFDRPEPVPDGAVAYVMFTSGTTGAPKAVRVPVGALRHLLTFMAGRFPIYPTDRVSQFYELNFDLSNFEIFLALWGGAALHVVPEAQRMAPGAFIREEKLTVWSSVPSVLSFMARTHQMTPGAFSTVRAAMFCGEPLPRASAEAFQAAAPGCAIDNQYGPTEATVSCTGEWVGSKPRVTPGRDIVSIGLPFPGTRAAIVDPEGRFLPRGEQGELALAGAQLALGYDDEALTARRFPSLTHPVHGKERWYLTGDLAYEDEDGHFHHLGRLDHQVKVVGHRVELEEIEAHLRELCGAPAIVVPHPVREGVAQGLVAFIVEGGWSGLTLHQALAARLPAYMVPKRLVPVAELPRTPNGKLDRKALARGLEGEVADGVR